MAVVIVLETAHVGVGPRQDAVLGYHAQGHVRFHIWWSVVLASQKQTGQL